jgi:hypothetical protein
MIRRYKRQQPGDVLILLVTYNPVWRAHPLVGLKEWCAKIKCFRDAYGLGTCGSHRFSAGRVRERFLQGQEDHGERAIVVETISLWPRSFSGSLSSLAGRGRRGSLLRLARSTNPPIHRRQHQCDVLYGRLGTSDGKELGSPDCRDGVAKRTAPEV